MRCMACPGATSGADSGARICGGRGWSHSGSRHPPQGGDGRVTVGSAGCVTAMSPWGCDTGALAGRKGAAPGAGGAFGGEPPWCWAGLWRALSRNPRRVASAAQQWCWSQDTRVPAAPALAQLPAPWGGLEGPVPTTLRQRVPLALQRAQRAELREAVWEQVEVKKLLQKKLQRLRERWERVQEPTALPEARGARSSGKAAQGNDAEQALLQELVAARLEEQLASRWHRGTAGLRRLLVFTALLQVAVLTLVLLQGDVPNGSVLAAPLGAAQRAPGSSSKTQLERE
ncbi:uncharacterized protein LOC110356599 isoform X2 [Columba livia]|uniref:uncharacterized protein LOC110356599 isoform X2 n=1 Tax=Columba livia TaxID=8932 RepID=UPI0031B9CE49